MLTTQYSYIYKITSLISIYFMFTTCTLFNFNDAINIEPFNIKLNVSGQPVCWYSIRHTPFIPL